MGTRGMSYLFKKNCSGSFFIFAVHFIFNLCIVSIVVNGFALSQTAKGESDLPGTVQNYYELQREVGSSAEYKVIVKLFEEGRYRDALPLLETAMEKMPQNLLLKADYLLCLVWSNAFAKAVEFYLRHEQELKFIAYVPRNSAKAFYECSNYEKAKLLYEQALIYDETDEEALKGFIYSLCHLEEYSQAHALVKKYRKNHTVQEKLLTRLDLHIYQREGDYKNVYINASRAFLDEEYEPDLKELQDTRRDFIAYLSADEITLLMQDYIHNSYLMHDIIAMDSGRYDALVSTANLPVGDLPFGFVLELAWAYFKTKRDDESIQLYQFILNKRPQSCLARIGLAYPLSREGRYEEALDNIQWSVGNECFEVEMLFAKAYLYEQKRDFLQAIETYNTILEIKPESVSALQLKMRSIADIGAVSHALEQTKAHDLGDDQFVTDLKGDRILDALRWNESDQALPLVEEQLRDNPENLRARYDYIIALKERKRMKEVLDQYEDVIERTSEIPYWVDLAVADAYMFLEQPDHACEFYKRSIEKGPHDLLGGLLGLFYSYQELRDWSNADATWDKIDRVLQTDKKIKKWQRVEAASAYGWYLAYQDKLNEAQEYFDSYVSQAAMNSSFRGGLGHVYLWRGWPRKALEEFKIAHNIYPKDMDVQTGTVVALNELNYKNEARSLADQLYKEYPSKKHVLDTKEMLEVEDMNELLIEAQFIDEDPGAQEYWVKTTVTEPILPTFKLYQEIIWQEARDDTSEGKDKYDWNRLGLGSEWIVIPQLVWRQALTFDYQEMEDFGYYTTLFWKPLDQLGITGGFNSFNLDIPIRARATGVEGESAFWDVRYRQNELRFFGASGGGNWYDDGNLNSYYKLYYDQNVLSTPDFKIRIGAEVYHSRNKKSDVDYFSPQHDLSFSLTPTLEWIHFSRYDKQFVSRLYPRMGFYKQHKYVPHTIGGITYEQLLRTSKTFELLWNVGWDRKIYDGDSSNVWRGFVTLKKKF